VSARKDSSYKRLLAQVPWTAPIYLPTEAFSPTAKIDGMRRVVKLHNVELDKTYRPRLKALRKAYSGRRRAFIIGNGPSLKQTDLSLLANEVTFCTNGFFLHFPEIDWRPTFHVVEDHLVAEDRAAEINALSGITKLYPVYLGYCLLPDADTIFFNHRARKSYPHGFDFSTDASKVTYTGCTVTFTCMQLAFYLGFEEIYLVGVDADYAMPADVRTTSDYGTGVLNMDSDDPNHFHPDYFGKGMRWHDPQVDKMLEAYGEARRVVERSGRRIYNATVGGKLEVFPRRSLVSLFPDGADRSQSARISRYPRIAVIDSTPVGGVTATGALKQTLLSEWPPERLLHVSAHGREDAVCRGGPIPPHAPPAIFPSQKDAAELITRFDPDVILYRPLPEKPALQTLFDRVRKQLPAPFMIWIMDDWLARLEGSAPKDYRNWRAQMAEMVGAAAANLSISEAMSGAMEARFAKPFFAIANGVDRAEWPAPDMPFGSRDEVLLRYSGGLAEDMSLDSVLTLARVVEDMSANRPLRLEINTRQHWFDKYAVRFARFARTTVSPAELSRAEYVAWLRGADIPVLAYNFDDASVQYTRFSMANKLPELLATGRPVLAIGPVEQATIDYLARHRLGALVTAPGEQPLRDRLEELLATDSQPEQIGAQGRSHALASLELGAIRGRFAELVRQSAGQRTHPDTASDAPALAALIKKGQSGYDHGGGDKLQGARITRILKFYLGWRGLLAALTLAALAAPAVRTLSTNSLWLKLIVLLPVFGGGLLIFLIGYLYTVMQDHIDLLERRMKAIAWRAGQGDAGEDGSI